MAERVIIFDTTLRDGEQSPGISLDVGEKLEIAEQLARLGVDVIEAGFPVASQGDFEAVQAIGAAVAGPVIAASRAPSWPMSTVAGRRCGARPALVSTSSSAPVPATWSTC